jgi:hypothetical protein
MVDAEELIRERIETLQTYIRALEKIEGVFWGIRLSKVERKVMAALDRKVGQGVQLLALGVGLLVMLPGLWVGRFFARNPLAFLGLVFTCGLIGVTLAMRIFHQARCRIARQEIRMAQLEIYRLENQQSIK